MRGLLSNIPKSDRSAVRAGFWLLFTVVASHALLETARDTLFLRELPAADLPWAYLAIAVLCIFAALVHHRLRSVTSRSDALVVTLLSVAIVTGVLWLATEGTSRASLFAVYVWTGLMASIVVVQIWLRLGAIVDIVSAKTGFAFAGAGGMAGAALGSWLAELILREYPPRALLVAASGGLFVAAAIAFTLSGGAGHKDEEDGEEITGIAEFLSLARNDSYLIRLLAIAALVPLPLTLTDYVFKAVVTANVAGADLGSFFARFYAITNTIALLLQLLLVPKLLARVGAVSASAMFPLALTLMAGLASTAGGLAFVIALKGVDGSLRHSLHRAGTEILFLPLHPAQRTTAKFLAEAMGQRGGQAIASLALLGAIGVGLDNRAIAAALALLCAVWLLGLIRLRARYVARFRSKLSALRAADRGLTVPSLELDSLETLIRALSSPQDDEVIAALDVLHTYGKADLIPGLILYHPSPEVVLRAMEVLAGEARDDTARLCDRLLDHADARVRAAAVRYRFDHLSAQRLELLTRQDPSPLVRATAILGRLAHAEDPPHILLDEIDDLLDDASLEVKRAVARAVSSLPVQVALPLSDRLLSMEERDVRTALAESLAERPDARFLPVLTALLATRDARFPARQAMLAIGDAALRHLEKEFQRPEPNPVVRLHVPRTISRFGNADAARVLVDALRRQPETVVRYKILRGLGRLRADDPSLPIEPAPLLDEAQRSLRRAIELLTYGVAVQQCLRRAETSRSPVVDLLPPLLAEKENAALERVFRALRILNPDERFDAVFEGLQSDDRQLRAESIEMLSHVVDDDLRTGLVPLSSFGDDEERLRDALEYFSPPLAPAALALHESHPSLDPRAAEEMVLLLRSACANDSDPVLRSVADLALKSIDFRRVQSA